jgi:hypothetical protein
VYFVLGRDLGGSFLVKVGQTTNIASRMNQLATGAPGIELIGCLRGKKLKDITVRAAVVGYDSCSLPSADFKRGEEWVLLDVGTLSDARDMVTRIGERAAIEFKSKFMKPEELCRSKARSQATR